MNIEQVKEILRDFLEFDQQFQLDDDALDYYTEQIINLGDQPCGLSIEEAHKRFKLNKKTLSKAQRLGILNDPLSNLDKSFLERLSALWAKAWFLRPQILRFKRSERVRLLDAPEFVNVWERRVYYWYLGQPEGLKDERNQSHLATTLPVKTVMIALLNYYPSLFSVTDKQWMYDWMQIKGRNLYEPIETGSKVSRKRRKSPRSILSLKTRIENIRKKAQSDRSYLKKKGMNHEEILSSRGIKETDLRQFLNMHRKFTYDSGTRTHNEIFNTNSKTKM